MRGKSSYIAIASLCILLTGCSNAGEMVSKVTSKVDSISNLEACREVYRIIGKATDQMVSKNFQSPFNFSSIAEELDLLSNKGIDSKLKGSLEVISDSLRKMSNESTFFEGNLMYSNEIPNLTLECAQK